MLTKDFLANMKTRLLDDKKRLEEDLADLANKEQGKFEPAYPESGSSSDDDNASEISAYADEVSLVEKLETELRDTQKALDALEAGNYGICKYCKTEIDPKRLEARPTSSACITCKKTLTQEL
jgi:RNA polymerase-binding transcription factor DksA